MDCKECKYYMTEYSRNGFGICFKDYEQPDVEALPIKTDDDSCDKAEAEPNREIT